MIPEFPQEKKLEISDKVFIEDVTKNFPPFSDFNFLSLWSWDIHQEVTISKLNENLVVKFTDYISNLPFYSFIGDKLSDQTAKTLLEYSENNNSGFNLKLIPEDSVKNLNQEQFLITEDRNNFDYIIPIELFLDFNRKKTRTKNNGIKQFLANFTVSSKDLAVREQDVRDEILNLLDKWGTYHEHDPVKMKNEKGAILRFMDCNFPEMINMGAYHENQLVGFCFAGIDHNNYATIHFCKTDASVSHGIYSYILQETAKIMDSRGVKFINIEQDLGLEGLRRWKMSLGNHIFLKKFNIEFQ